jgi:hypothetical protein
MARLRALRAPAFPLPAFVVTAVPLLAAPGPLLAAAFREATLVPWFALAALGSRLAFTALGAVLAPRFAPLVLGTVVAGTVTVVLAFPARTVPALFLAVVTTLFAPRFVFAPLRPLALAPEGSLLVVAPRPFGRRPLAMRMGLRLARALRFPRSLRRCRGSLG